MINETWIIKDKFVFSFTNDMVLTHLKWIFEISEIFLLVSAKQNGTIFSSYGASLSFLINPMKSILSKPTYYHTEELLSFGLFFFWSPSFQKAKEIIFITLVHWYFMKSEFGSGSLSASETEHAVQCNVISRLFCAYVSGRRSNGFPDNLIVWLRGVIFLTEQRFRSVLIQCRYIYGMVVVMLSKAIMTGNTGDRLLGFMERC